MGNNKAVEIIRSKADGRHPKVAIILGTGLGPFAENIENKILFPRALKLQDKISNELRNISFLN